jgi:DTW domain-containing protein YfiP
MIPRLETRTRLVLVVHFSEIRKPTNTGGLAASCLVNSEVVVRGREGQRSDEVVWDERTQPLLLFPHEGEAKVLAETDRPVTLIVPDGNWRQAAKVRQRVPGLRDIPCVTLPPGAPSSYRLRAEPHPGGLATLEAIARALEILEGPEAGPRTRAALEHVFRAMVERTLWMRGAIPTEEVTGGLPEDVMLRDPRSGHA